MTSGTEETDAEQAVAAWQTGYGCAERDIAAWLRTQVPIPTCEGIAMRIEHGDHRVFEGYPPGWPRCPGCERPALDGHVTCGEEPCSDLELGRNRRYFVRLRKLTRGRHVVVDVFVGQTEGSLGNAGSLIMGRDEWVLFAGALGKGARRMHALSVSFDGDLALPLGREL
jgi:hypothetical protein